MALSDEQKAANKHLRRIRDKAYNLRYVDRTNRETAAAHLLGLASGQRGRTRSFDGSKYQAPD